MGMTTGNHKMTELAFSEGIQMNWLLSPKGKDGLLITDMSGNPKILDKREINLSDLVNESDFKDAAISAACARWLKSRGLKGTKDCLSCTIKPFEDIRDRAFFLKILKLKKYSLLSGMLLINGDEVYKMNDGQTSRRFFVEFEDGKFGIMNSVEDMSTGDLVDISLKFDVKRAIYMDTGMYDMATYRDGNGKDHVIGHQDTNESTNRVVIYSK
jgi:hypothetical protein